MFTVLSNTRNAKLYAIAALVIMIVVLLTLAIVPVSAPDQQEHFADLNNPASVLEVKERPANLIDTYRARSYRSNYGERQVPIASYRSPLDVCYDVPLREVASCHNASQAPVPAYGSPLDVCYDVSLREAAACRLAEQADAP